MTEPTSRASVQTGDSYGVAGENKGTVNQYFGSSTDIKRPEESSKAESVGTLKAGDPRKSLAHWQGRDEEIAQLRQLLSNKTPLIGIEGIGGTGKSTLAAKVFEEIEGFPKRYWADVSTGALFTELARQLLTEFGYRVPDEESQLVAALVKCLQSGQCLLVIDNLESLLQADGQWQSQFYGEFFGYWLEYGNNSTVLVTTREQPTLKGLKWLPPPKRFKNTRRGSFVSRIRNSGRFRAFYRIGRWASPVNQIGSRLTEV